MKTEYRHINYIKNFSLVLHFKKLFRMGKASACKLPPGCLHRGNNHLPNNRRTQAYRTKNMVDGTGINARRCGTFRINVFKLMASSCAAALNRLSHRAFDDTTPIIAIQAVCASHIGRFALRDSPFCCLAKQPVQQRLQHEASWLDISNQHRHYRPPGRRHKRAGANGA